MKLHLVDGTYELYRAHYAPRPGHYSPSGSDAKATVGIVESLLSLLSDPKEALFLTLFREYSRALQSANAFDFDDLIAQTVYLFRAFPAVAALYRRRSA